MTDKDTITLPREVVEQLLKMLEMVEPYADQLTDYSSTAAEWPLNLLPEKVGVAITALRTHLAAEPTKPEPVAWMDRFGSVVLGKGPYETFTTPLYTFPPALAAEQPKHPGYVIGSHWLETAYSRICAGEAEADVLRDIGLVREEAFLTGVAHLKAENEALRRDAERLKDAMRKAMAMLDKHEPEPAGAFAVLLLALNPELQSAKNAALRREEDKR